MAKVRELRKGLKAIKDLELLKLLKSVINFEFSSNHFQNAQSGSLGKFVVESDSAHSKDVVLRRRCDSGEEVALSALLGPRNYEKELIFTRDVLMEVCVKKPALCSILQFDCKGSEFDINGAYYLRSPSCLGSSIYKIPLFSELDSKLQNAFKELDSKFLLVLDDIWNENRIELEDLIKVGAKGRKIMVTTRSNSID